ncbi:MAG: hypothetical protein ACRDPM_19145, partial [Solirubrobacteraceae bacterium]
MLGHSIGSDNTYQLRRPWLACTQALFEPTLITRLRARTRRLELDHALAEGADPSSSPVLAARAAQLVSRSNRHRLAVALERLALTAEASHGLFHAMPRRQSMRANRAELLGLAQTLRRGELLYARGVAIL